MKDNDSSFYSIQKILVENAKSSKKTRNGEGNKSNNIIQFPYSRVDLKNDPVTENMGVKNIKITEKGKNTTLNNALKLVIGVAVVGTMIFSINKVVSEINPAPVSNDVGIVYMDEGYIEQKDENVINPSDCNFSNTTIIFREATDNVSSVVSVADEELKGLGVSTVVIDEDDDMIAKIGEIRKNDNDLEIIVINVDGLSNKGNTQTVLMTNYSNSAKSADALALAIHNSNEDIYDITSDIRCGKKDLTNGRRTKTSVENALDKAGYKDIACLTIAPNENCLSNTNNLATSIAEGVVRVEALSENERNHDYIRRVEFGDTISELAEENEVTSSYIESANREILNYYNGNLQYNTAMIVSYLPKQITSQMTVNNKMITTDPTDIVVKTAEYTVVENDTVSTISEKLGVGVSELVVPSGDIDFIKIGDKINYETTVGPILVTKTPTKNK